MPEQGDKKTYIGDVWVDKLKEGYQEKFIRDIIESFEGHEKGFNADMVDGKHAIDFATAAQGQLAVTALQSIQLGKTILESSINSQYIETDAIILEESAKENIPWDKWYNTEYAESGKEQSKYTPENLTQAIEYLFKLIQNGVDKLDNDKVSKSKVIINDIVAQDNQGNDRWQVLSDNNFTDEDKAILQSLSGSVTELECSNSETGVSEGTKIAVNADTINGLQFILVTKEIYNELSNDCKNNWRNIFIFVDEIPPDYDSPLNTSFANGFEFKVDGNYIVYKNKDATQWLNLIDLSTLYSKFTSDVHNTIVNTINNESDSISEGVNNAISQNTIESIIKNIDAISMNDAKSWPFIPQILSDDFVYDIYYRPESGIETSFPSTTISQSNYVFKRIDLTNIYDSFKSFDNDLKIEIKDYVNEKTNALERRINAIENIDIPTKLEEIEGNIGILNTNIGIYNSSWTNISNRLSTLESKVDQLESWKNESNMVHLMIGRWNTRDYDNRDVTNIYGEVNLNVYDETVAERDGESDMNPGGIYVRISNNLDTGSGFSNDILKDIIVKLSIKGVEQKTLHRQNYELWFGFDSAAKYQSRWREISPTVQTNAQSQKYYMSDKISIEWVDITTSGIAYYLVEATPYYKGKICGNTVDLSLKLHK